MKKRLTPTDQGPRTHRATAECHAALCDRAIEIAGRRFVPDEFSAYVEFYLGHSFPVVITDGTALHPQVVANSHLSLEGKVFNFVHLMRSYNPKEIPRDRILGTVVAVELTRPLPPDGVWLAPVLESDAVGIRCVAVMHKQAEGVQAILDYWAQGKTPFTETPWTVSMENRVDVATCSFLVQGDAGLEEFAAGTPADLRDQGWVNVPLMEAPLDLARCMNTEEDDEAEARKDIRLCRQFAGRRTVLLIGGLAGSVRFKGVGLCPRGKEHTARVAEMLAAFPLEEDPVVRAFGVLGDFAKKILISSPTS